MKGVVGGLVLAAAFCGLAGPVAVAHDMKLVLPFGTAKVWVVDRHALYFYELQGGSTGGFVSMGSYERIDSPKALLELPGWAQHLELQLGGYVEVVVEWIQDNEDLGFELRHRMGRLDPVAEDRSGRSRFWSVPMTPEEVKAIAKETKADVVLVLDHARMEAISSGRLLGGQRGRPPLIKPAIGDSGDGPPVHGRAFNTLRLGMVAYDGESGEELDRVIGVSGSTDFGPIFEQRELDHRRVQEYENVVKEAFWFAMQRVEFE